MPFLNPFLQAYSSFDIFSIKDFRIKCEMMEGGACGSVFVFFLSELRITPISSIFRTLHPKLK